MNIHLICVRHGITDWNQQNRFIGHKDEFLNQIGMAQARAVGERLAVQALDANYNSDLQRSVQNAQAIADRHGMLPIHEPRLREIYLGEWEGYTYSEILELCIGKQQVSIVWGSYL